MTEGQRLDYSPIPEVNKIKLDADYTSIARAQHSDEENQDKALLKNGNNSFAIFDGVGGCTGGKMAAELASKVFDKWLRGVDPYWVSSSLIEERFEFMFKEANTLIQEQPKNPDGTQMGTTAVAVSVTSSESEGKKLHIGYVGDSRVYVWRNGELKRITADHNAILYEDPQNYEYYQKALDNYDGSQTLTPGQEYFYKKRSQISRGLGYGDAKPDFYHINLQHGDKVILTTDGVHDNLTTLQIEEIVRKNRKSSAKKISEKIVHESVKVSREGKKRSKPDDMTTIVIDIELEEANKHQSKNETKVDLPKKFKPKVGQSINVQRSNGIIESGWNILLIRPDKSIVVRKRIGSNEDDVITKTIGFAAAEKLNHQQTPEDIFSSQNFDQLNFTLKHLGGVQGSQDFYPSDFLIPLIDSIRRGEKPLKNVTRSYGLRDTVGRLLQGK